jgi:hypothetical protein
MNGLPLGRGRLAAVLVSAALLAAAFLAWTGRPVAAQPGAGPEPTGGLWCGATPEGYRVYIQLSPDGRFVEWAEAHTPRFLVSTRERDVRGVTRAQVADGKFIFRQRRDETVCERDARDPRDRCTTVTVEDVTIRGSFQSPASMRGSFSGQFVTRPLDDRDDRLRPRRTLVTGSYNAWPASVSPCR